MINDPEFSFKEIAEELGFSSSPHLTTYCQRMFGMTPSQLREKNKDKTVTKNKTKEINKEKASPER